MCEQERLGAAEAGKNRQEELSPRGLSCQKNEAWLCHEPQNRRTAASPCFSHA